MAKTKTAKKKTKEQAASGGVDAAREIRRAVDTGKVLFGTKSSGKSLKNGTAKLLIIANNVPQLEKEKLVALAETSRTPNYMFSGSGLELGSVCGKPFTVSVMVVEDEGKSKVLGIQKQ